jgi:magnesium chelatase subunit H
MLEAHGRGLWNADENRLNQLRQLYELTDEQLEGVGV